MKLIALVLSIILTPLARASTDEVYYCKNKVGLPDNVYKIRAVSLGTPEVVLPYLEITRFYRNPSGHISSSTLKGFASEFNLPLGRRALTIGAVQLEFDGENLAGCQKQ